MTYIKYLYGKIGTVRNLKYFTCLVPKNIKKPISIRYIIKIVSILPLVNADCDLLSNEWKLLQVDTEVTFVLKRNERIDTYCINIFSLVSESSVRYPFITHIVQVALSLTHGSADIERGFSETGRILTDDKARMDVKMLNARFNIIDGMDKFDSIPYKVRITGELLKLARIARQAYHNYLEDQKKKKKKIEEEKKKQENEDLERRKKEEQIQEKVSKNIESIKTLETQLSVEEDAYKVAISESESMQEVLKHVTKTSKSTVVLQELVSSLENVRNKETEQRKKVEKLREKVEKRRSTLINMTVAKKFKT